jgi:hypothetical protein
LFDFIQKRDKAIAQFKKEHAVKSLPKYEIPWISNWGKSAFMIHPQVSYYQAPLLEHAPQVIDTFLNQKDPVPIFFKMRPLLNK